MSAMGALADQTQKPQKYAETAEKAGNTFRFSSAVSA